MKATVFILTDSLDGKTTEGVETVSFSYGGTDYSVELSPANRDRLAKALAPFLKVAEVAVPEKSSGSRNSRTDAEAVRVWARSNGFPDVKERGRLGSDILTAYDAAHGTAAVESAPTGQVEGSEPTAPHQGPQTGKPASRRTRKSAAARKSSASK
jgi:hypothetical protein